MKLTRALMRSIRASGVAMPDPDGHAPTYLPTQDEIAAECREIRSTWSEAEKRRRRGASKGDGDSWNLPVCREVEQRDDE